MRLPHRIPGLKPLTILVVAYAFIWIALEGDLAQVVLLAVGLVVTALGHAVRRRFGGRVLSAGRWLALAATVGLAAGAGSAVMALLLMALKTGLHAHGPEFSPADIAWVVDRLPWWAAGGVIGGLGFGLILWSLRHP